MRSGELNGWLISTTPRVVTGERIVPLQPMQVVKGDQNGYPVSGGTAGPPCPGGYKYVGLALQFGGWATGRQPFTAKNLLGNLNCDPGTGRLSGIDLASGKGLMR